MRIIPINNRGQALLAVTVLMTIALAVGIGVSVRSLSSSSRASQSDTSARVLAVAEGGAENYLVKSSGDLSDLTAICTDYATSSNNTTCTITFDSLGEDNINSRAVVSVAKYGEGETQLDRQVLKDTVVETNLEGYTGSDLTVCWNGDSAISYSAYSDTDMLRGVIDCSSCSYTGLATENISSATSSSGSYDSCETVTLPAGTLWGFRLRSLGADSDVSLLASSGSTFPMQGYEVISVGELDGIDSDIKVSRTVTVRVSLPYFPGVFDYAIYADSGIID